MNDLELLKFLNDIKSGIITVDDALKKLKLLPFEDLFFAKIDHHRELRKGFPEIIYCKGKKVDQILKIIKSISDKNQNILATRANEDIYFEVKKLFQNAEYYSDARIIFIKNKEINYNTYSICVISAGTSDISVAEEAAITSEKLGNNVERIYDVGVAGIHRLFPYIDKIKKSSVLIVVAGMDGALPSFIGGLFDKPIIAVPTSVGYGANFNGIAPLLTMLNNCSGNVSVVNIDNGFGAGYIASLINKQIEDAINKFKGNK